jgi:hypothetical protein
VNVTADQASYAAADPAFRTHTWSACAPTAAAAGVHAYMAFAL